MKTLLASRPVVATASAFVLAAAIAGISLNIVALSTVVGGVAAVGILGLAALDYSGQLRPRAFGYRSTVSSAAHAAEVPAAMPAALATVA